MREIAEIIRAIATLLWPILAFVILFLFKGQIRELLTRLKKGKLFGQEVELESTLKKLESSSGNLQQR